MVFVNYSGCGHFFWRPKIQGLVQAFQSMALETLFQTNSTDAYHTVKHPKGVNYQSGTKSKSLSAQLMTLYKFSRSLFHNLAFYTQL